MSQVPNPKRTPTETEREHAALVNIVASERSVSRRPLRDDEQFAVPTITMNTPESAQPAATPGEDPKPPQQLTVADVLELIELHGCDTSLKVAFADDSPLPIHGFYIINGEVLFSSVSQERTDRIAQLERDLAQARAENAQRIKAGKWADEQLAALRASLAKAEQERDEAKKESAGLRKLIERLQDCLTAANYGDVPRGWDAAILRAEKAEAEVAELRRDREIMEWADRYLLTISAHTSPDMGGLRFTMQARNPAKERGAAGSSYVRESGRDFRSTILAAITKDAARRAQPAGEETEGGKTL